MTLMVKFLAIFFGLALPFLFVSCDDDRKEKVEEKSIIKAEQKTIELELDQKPNDPSSFKVKLNFPEQLLGDSSAIKNRLEREINYHQNKSLISDTVYQSYQEVLDEIEIAYQNFKEDFPEVEAKWYLNRSSEIAYQTEEFITIEFKEDAYLGGAHPSEMLFYQTFDKKVGGRRILADYFSPEELERMRNLGEAQFRNQKGLSATEDLKEHGWSFPTGKFSLSSNFCFTDTSVIIYYNRYDISSYAAGATKFELALNKIRDNEL